MHARGQLRVRGGRIDNLNAGTATLEDTIVAANTGVIGSPNDIGGNNAIDVVGSYDLIGPGGSGGIGNGSQMISLSTLTGIGLASAGNYGGPTATIALLPGSPAIGAGIKENGVDSDQRGESLDSPSPDIGAFQSQGFTLTPATGSTPQSTTTGSQFANPLSVTVVAKNPEEPVAGGVVNFGVESASNGAAATLSSMTATIGTRGIAQVDATAGATAGAYSVVASTAGATIDVFTLTNLYPLSFSAVADQTIAYGTASVTISGKLADGSEIPVGGTVAIICNGDEQDAVISSNGNFSASFDTSSFTVLDSPWPLLSMVMPPGP